jgi:phytoene dehydrogenase-like protein
VSSAVVVGSGPNGLAAALTLADAGLTVRVLEMADVLGGGMRSSELTVPGVLHDECSAAHPLALSTPFSRQFDLGAHGLTWRWTDVEYAHPLDGGDGAAAWRSVQKTAERLPGRDGRRWRTLFGPLTDDFSDLAEEIVQPVLHLPRHPIALARFGLWSGLPASVLAKLWRTPAARALFAGVAAHAFRPFGSPLSSAIGVTLGTAAHRFGWPVAEGGSRAIAHAMIAAAEQRGVRFETGVEVTSLEEVRDADVVMLDLAPAAAARIAGDRMPSRIARALRRFRHGPGSFKVDFAVDGGVPWTHEPSRHAGTVHVGGTFEEIAAAEREVARGRMPDRPFVLVCQQSLADPGRAKDGVHPLYAYAHVPAGWPGDATAAIEAQIERFAPGFRDRVVGRHVRSVAAIEEHNPNWVGGDIITGANDPLQMIFRPRITTHPYATGIPGVFLCSAATPPGAGAHGMCGHNAANAALQGLGSGD